MAAILPLRVQNTLRLEDTTELHGEESRQPRGEKRGERSSFVNDSFRTIGKPAVTDKNGVYQD